MGGKVVALGSTADTPPELFEEGGVDRAIARLFGDDINTFRGDPNLFNEQNIKTNKEYQTKQTEKSKQNHNSLINDEI